MSLKQVYRKYLLIPAGVSFTVGTLWVTGCGPDEGLKALPLDKSKEEFQKQSEQLPGIPVQDTAKTKKKGR